MVHCRPARGVGLPGALKVMARMTRDHAHGDAIGAVGRYRGDRRRNAIRPSGSIVWLGALTGVDMKTFWSGTRPTRSSSLSCRR